VTAIHIVRFVTQTLSRHPKNEFWRLGFEGILLQYIISNVADCHCLDTFTEVIIYTSSVV